MVVWGCRPFCSTIPVVYTNLAGKILKTFFTVPIRSHFVTLFCFLIIVLFSALCAAERDEEGEGDGGAGPHAAAQLHATF